ncbi:MAG TPA: transglycosylase SLT domain-containing protein [Fibrobacteria bacterium]|nr:transglycosylase SLT domain-containing protein [Fibrobacteria bacterium]
MPRFDFTFFRMSRAALLACLLLPATGCAEPRRAGMSDSSTVDPKDYRAAWDEAIEAYGKGRYLRAASLFEKLTEGDSLASLYRSSLTASARLRAGDTAGADRVVASALAIPFVATDSVWAGYFHRMRMRTLSGLPPAARRDYLRVALRTPISFVDRVATLYRLLDMDTSLVVRGERLEYLRRLTTATPDARLDAAYRRGLALFTADTTRETQRLFLDLEERLSLWSAAIARGEQLSALTPDTALARSLQLKISLWYFNTGSYAESIKRYEGWLLRYGESSEAMLQIARAYRGMGREEASRDAYSRLVERFPKDSRAAEVLWMRAFDDEMAGRTDSALAGYDRIARDFPQHARSGEAMFRAGLVRLRGGDGEGARAAFVSLQAARKGKLMGAARYWEGKALAGLALSGLPADTARGAEAVAAWSSLVREYPFGHYGHLAREELLRRGALPDSLAWAILLNRAEGPAVAQWLDAATPMASPRPEGFGESRYLPVRSLFDLGLDTLAVLTLQARANASAGALRPWYEAATSCRAAGFDYEAYRFGQKLADRLPIEKWPSAPVAILRLFYPPSYDTFIRSAAERHGVPARLASALIKQESGFDPNAVSRVGARGLMQLMPATGAEQARKDGYVGFHADSLFVPSVNVRLGVAYLGDLLRRHGGDVSLTLAHYNAGPTALERWMPRLEGRPPEDVAEDIGYAETRDYVKRVGANWKTYRVLWGDTSRASEGAR